MSAQVRLEALKLAVQSGAQGGNILTIAEEYTNFISGGPKVVEIYKAPPETTDVEPQATVAQHPNHQRRSRKRR